MTTTKPRSTPRLFEVSLAPGAVRDFHRLPLRARTSADNFLRTVMREEPEKYGLRLRGALKGWLLVKRAGFRVTYRIDHDQRQVFILRVEPL